MATTEDGSILESLADSSSTSPSVLCNRKQKLVSERDQRYEAKRKFMSGSATDNFVAVKSPNRDSLSTRIQSPVAPKSGASPPPLPSSSPPTSTPALDPDKDSDCEVDTETTTSSNTVPSLQKVSSAFSSAEVIYTIEDDSFVAIEDAETPPTPPRVYDGENDPFSRDFEDNISTDLANDNISKDEGISSSDNNLEYSSSCEDVLNPANSVYFESSGVIDINENHDSSLGNISSDDRLVEVALTFEPDDDYIDCLVDSGDERSNSPVCIEQLDTSNGEGIDLVLPRVEKKDKKENNQGVIEDIPFSSVAKEERYISPEHNSSENLSEDSLSKNLPEEKNREFNCLARENSLENNKSNEKSREHIIVLETTEKEQHQLETQEVPPHCIEDTESHIVASAPTESNTPEVNLVLETPQREDRESEEQLQSFEEPSEEVIEQQGRVSFLDDDDAKLSSDDDSSITRQTCNEHLQDEDDWAINRVCELHSDYDPTEHDDYPQPTVETPNSDEEKEVKTTQRPALQEKIISLDSHIVELPQQQQQQQQQQREETACPIKTKSVRFGASEPTPNRYDNSCPGSTLSGNRSDGLVSKQNNCNSPDLVQPVISQDHLNNNSEKNLKSSTKLDFLFPDISNLCMKVNMRKPEPPRPLEPSLFTPPAYRRPTSFDVEPRDLSSDEDCDPKNEAPINIRDYTISAACKANDKSADRSGQTKAKTTFAVKLGSQISYSDNNGNSTRSQTRRVPPPLMKKPSIDETAAILEASRRPNARPTSLQNARTAEYVNNVLRPQSTSALLNDSQAPPIAAAKPAFTEDSISLSTKHRPAPLDCPINTEPRVDEYQLADFMAKKNEFEIDEDGKMKIFSKQQSLFMNTDQYSPELVVKSPAPILDKSATFTGFFTQAPRELVVSPTVPSPITATPPTPHRLLATPPTPHRSLQAAPPSPQATPPQNQQQQRNSLPPVTSTPNDRKKGPAPLPPVRHSELAVSISDSASNSSKTRHFDFNSVSVDARTESVCSSISDRALSPCLTASSTSEPRPITPRPYSSVIQRPRHQPPSPPRHANTSGPTSSEDYLEVNVRQAQELATQAQQQRILRQSRVTESDSGCFVVSPDQRNVNSLNSLTTSDLDNLSRDPEEEGDSYFSEDSSLRRHHRGVADVDHVSVSAPVPTEYSTDTITRHQTDSDTRYETVSELLISERSYVDRLHFLSRIVVLNLKVLSKLPDDMASFPYDIIEKTFPCIETIFNFHACTLLPKLEDRILEWKKDSCINDLMSHLCKILPTYQKFVAKVSQSLKNLDLYRNTNVVFAKLMEEVEKVAECRRLPIKQHLLDITNRVSMYRDFLFEYQRNQPIDDIRESLQELKDMSHSIERFMGKEERLVTLQNMQKRLDTDVNFVTPTNELIKEGFLKSVSTQGNKRAPRYVFLLNEALLLCTTAGTISNKHQIKCIAVVDGLQIFGGDNLMLANTFYVQGKRHTIELQASSAEQKHEWIMRIREMIDGYTAKKLCAAVNVNYEVKPEEVGKYKPDKATTSRVASCSLCGCSFRSTRRKHHCKACGQVICANCCCQKARLEYCEFRLSKVCDECYVIIRKVELTQGADLWSDKSVQAYDQGAMSGFVQLSYNNGHSWVKRWITVHRDRILYCFKSETDEKPFTTLPIRRFQVAITTKEDSVHKNNSFKIYNMKRTYFLVTDDSKSLLSWLKILNDLQESI